MGTPGLVRRVRVSFPGGSRDEPWVPLARTGGGWGTLLVAKDAESGGHSPLEGWLVGLAPGEGGRVRVCVCVCVCVFARETLGFICIWLSGPWGVMAGLIGLEGGTVPSGLCF